MENAGTIFLPVIVVGELLAGFARSRRRRENEVALAEFLEESFVRTIEVDQSVARHYASLLNEVRKKGHTVAANDLWIAACTAGVDAELLSFDADFKRIPGLRLSLFTK
jgi:predicted nucleic acid-binding protein